MPADADAIGINTCTHSLAQKVSVGRKTEAVSPLVDRQGAFVKGATLGGDGDFTIEGKGELPAGLGFGHSPGIDSLSGTIIVTGVEESEDAKDWNSWTITGEFCPHAS